MIARTLLPVVLAAAAAAPASALVPGITDIPGFSVLASIGATTTLTGAASQPTSGIDGLTGVSVACLTSLAGLIPASPDQPGKCLGLDQAIGIFGAQVANQQSSLVQPIKKYLDEVICSQDSCAGTVLKMATDKVSNDCTDADLAIAGGINIPNAVKYVTENYVALRTASCFKNKSSGDYCVIQTLDTLEKSTGKSLSLSELQTVLVDGNARADILKKLEGDKANFCTDCNKALYSQLSKTDVDGVKNATLVSSQIRDAISNVCGATYIDGKYPNTIINSTKEALALNGGAIEGAVAGSSSSSAGSSSSTSASGAGPTSTSQSGTSGTRTDGANANKASALAAVAVAFGVALLF